MNEFMMALHNFLPDMKNGCPILLALYMHSLDSSIQQILGECPLASLPGRLDLPHQQASLLVGDTDSNQPDWSWKGPFQTLTSAMEEIRKETDPEWTELGSRGHLSMSGLGKKEGFLWRSDLNWNQYSESSLPIAGEEASLLQAAKSKNRASALCKQGTSKVQWGWRTWTGWGEVKGEHSGLWGLQSERTGSRSWSWHLMRPAKSYVDWEGNSWGIIIARQQWLISTSTGRQSVLPS